MRLTDKAINAINKQDIRPWITLELGCSEDSTKRYIKANESNGPLTTAGALSVIRDKTGLTDDELLERESIAL
ncbi:MAG: hypothetical protein WKF88_05565 [Ferruginibacter sp.]